MPTLTLTSRLAGESLGLLEALDAQPIVFLDGSANLYNREVVANKKWYTQINPAKLRDMIEANSGFMDIQSHTHVRTIPEVTEENKHYQRAVEDIMDQLRRMDFYGKPAPAKEKTRDKVKALLEKIYLQTITICQLSRKTELVVTDPKYSILAEMIKTIDQSFVRQDVLSGNPAVRKDPSETDRRLVASLYWQAFNGERAALLEYDKHFKELIGKTPLILFSPQFQPYNTEFMNQVSSNEFVIYRRNPGNEARVKRLTIQDLIRLERGNLRINGHSRELYNSLGALWKRFAAKK